MANEGRAACGWIRGYQVQTPASVAGAFLPRATLLESSLLQTDFSAWVSVQVFALLYVHTVYWSHARNTRPDMDCRLCPPVAAEMAHG